MSLRWDHLDHFYGLPAELTDAAAKEAAERDDPLLAEWAATESQRRAAWAHYHEHHQFSDDLPSAYKKRLVAIETWAFSVTCRAALEQISAFAEGLVSVGAGMGWWESRLAKEQGLDVLAFDGTPPPDGNNYWWAGKEPYCLVQRGDAEIGAEYPDRTLFLSWPNYGTPMGEHAVRAYRKAGGQRIVYIGEDTGCCGTEAMFDEFDEHWVEVDRGWIPQWDGLHDDVTFYVRRK